MPSIKGLATGLALLASAVLGNPTQKRGDGAIRNAISHTMTAWDDQIRFYYVDKDTHFIQEACNGEILAQNTYQSWRTCTALRSFTVADDGAISVINTYGTNKPGIEVYTFDNSNNLRSYEWRDGVGWKATFIRHIPERKTDTPIRAVTWTQRGVVHRSIFYNDDKGMKEITKGDQDVDWHITVVGGGSFGDGLSGDFAVSTIQLSERDVEKTVWTMGNKTAVWNGGWVTTVDHWGKLSEPGSDSIAMFEDPRRFYLNNGNGQIIEKEQKVTSSSTLGTPGHSDTLQLNYETLTRELVSDIQKDSRISVVHLKKKSGVMTYVLHKNKLGMLAMAWDNGDKWLAGSAIIRLDVY